MQLFTEDIVERIDGSAYGVVARTWHEQPDDPAMEIPEDPLLRHLQRGEIGFQTFPNGSREILPESAFKLIDRGSFVRGDYCKRAHDDHQSGVVLNLKVQFKIQHTITLQSLDQWFDKEDFQAGQPLLLGDLVFYDDWVGQVEEIFNEALMVSSTSKMQPVYELGGRFAVGEKFYTPTNGESAPSQELDDVIVKVTPIAAAISWSAINQALESSIAQERQRPQQLWPINDLHKLAVMKPRGSVVGSIGERIVFKDPAKAAQLNIHNMLYKDQEMKVEVNVDAMVIRQTQTQIEVLWQDGTREWVPSTSLIPHLNLDEYECWPGDFVLWKNDGERKVAVVQSVSAKERVASVRWFGTDITEDVSVLELDPHGISHAEGNTALHSFGVRRGDCVLIHKEDSEKGAKMPLIPRIGELEHWVHEPPSRTPDGTVEGWRGALTKLAIQTLGFDWTRAEEGGRAAIPLNLGWDEHSVNVMTGGAPGKLVPPTLSPARGIGWFGQVIDLTLGGDAIVCLPSNEHVVLPLSRLSLYRDIEDYHWDGMDAPGEDTVNGAYDDGDLLFEDAWNVIEEDERNDWSHMEVDEDPPEAEIETGEPNPLTPIFGNNVIMPGTFPPSPPLSQDETSDTEFRVSSSSPETKVAGSPRKNSYGSDEEVKMLLIDQQELPTDQISAGDLDPEIHWKRFDILPEAPRDHAFFSFDPLQPSKAFLARLSKEYRVLQSSLPDSILVRAYEDRTDLMRCLIMGPENTPYEDAPFVIDWRLDDAFPQSPPIAHFLSWTNGNGRVNPNLYEDGKVCLSILGTWAGDRNESWNAARSSLLQAFVSIQGLVLVKDPYFCEPSYEKMRGTEEGMLNSRLYSEKAYVLSRGFVRRALELPPGGLEGEIRWFYDTKRGLVKVLADARKLIAQSSSEDSIDMINSDKAVPWLSTGGVLTLTRTLNKLNELLGSRGAGRTMNL